MNVARLVHISKIKMCKKISTELFPEYGNRSGNELYFFQQDWSVEQETANSKTESHKRFGGW
uniref:Uncharacterized protein n=1 Tax=Candidatus Kentrum sp. LFY TaxID=2126342 RepID=A0A450UR86_9GAMM|nr:MAG: hypothetical protein BECKLFY1418B_GA0070995_106514 [Candidatus Kentron sp. LFY]